MRRIGLSCPRCKCQNTVPVTLGAGGRAPTFRVPCPDCTGKGPGQPRAEETPTNPPAAAAAAEAGLPREQVCRCGNRSGNVEFVPEASEDSRRKQHRWRCADCHKILPVA